MIALGTYLIKWVLIPGKQYISNDTVAGLRGMNDH
jgi:hypothetical protein